MQLAGSTIGLFSRRYGRCVADYATFLTVRQGHARAVTISWSEWDGGAARRRRNPFSSDESARLEERPAAPPEPLAHRLQGPRPTAPRRRARP
ncbi:hypothetical protein HMPREF1550_01407 [Actinomyces sp. oral taxon 877 str. F0543]|nr:hypothetical protein HMPREF1550_01407 [Actinomyces sp. oral taxon 877 str. F0543]